MSTSLTKLKGFVQTYGSFNTAVISENERQELETYFSETLQLIKQEIIVNVELVFEEIQQFQYSKNLQVQLTLLANSITGYENDYTQQDIKTVSLPKWILKQLYDLLEFLSVHNKDFFNFKGLLPNGYLNDFEEKILVYKQRLVNQLTNSNADQALIVLLQRYLNPENLSETLSIGDWEEWKYFLQTIQIFADFENDSRDADINLEYLKLFLRRDFNSIHVYSYFLKYMEKATGPDLNFLRQQEELLYLIKVFKQVRIESPIRYRTQIQSLKTTVLDSLTAELNYLEDKEKAMLQSFKGTATEGPTRFYFKALVNLQELMFFFRILLEVGFFQTKFNSYLYDFVANHIRTERAENISRKSMRNHFSNKPFPDRIVGNIRNWLTKMVGHIDLYYKN